MSFSKDVRHYQMSPRSLQTSKFGPYSQLTVEQKHGIKGWLWAIAYGVAIGAGWWALVAIRAGM